MIRMRRPKLPPEDNASGGALTDGSAAHDGNLALLGRRHLAAGWVGGSRVGGAGRQN